MSVPARVLQDLNLSRDGDYPLATAAWAHGMAGLRRHQAGDVFLGYMDDGTPLGVPDDRHILMVAGARAGKGATILIPSLAIYRGSVVVIDPKGENAVVTARRRANGSAYANGLGQKVVLLDPFCAVHTPEDGFADLRGGFNPMDLVDPARPESVGDAVRIADAIVMTEQSKDPYWEESARTLIKSVILHVVSSKDFAPDQKNLCAVWKLIQAGDSARNALAAMSGGRKRGGTALSLLFKSMERNPAFDGTIARAGVMFGDLERNAPKTLAGIAQIASGNLEFLENPEMQACLSRSSLALSELKTDPKGVSLFLSLPQAYMGTHFRWMRMVTTLLVAEMERHRFQPRSGQPVLLVLDEFAALKRMSVIENAAAQIAGFGVRMVFVAQTLAQLKDVYKENWETFIANSGVKLFFGNDDHFTRDYVSRLIGETEIIRTLTTVSETQGTTKSKASGLTQGSTLTNSWGVTMGGQSASSSQGGSQASAVSRTSTDTDGTSYSRTVAHAQSLHKRLLLNPDEVGRLFGRRDQPAALVLVSGHQPLALRREAYHEMRWLDGCYGWHPDHARPETLAARQAKLLAVQHAAEQKRKHEYFMLEMKAAREQAEAESLRAWQAAQFERHRLYQKIFAVIGVATIIWSAWQVSGLFGGAMLLVPGIRWPVEKPEDLCEYRCSRSPLIDAAEPFALALIGLAGFLAYRASG